MLMVPGVVQCDPHLKGSSVMFCCLSKELREHEADPSSGTPCNVIPKNIFFSDIIYKLLHLEVEDAVHQIRTVNSCLPF